MTHNCAFYKVLSSGYLSASGEQPGNSCNLLAEVYVANHFLLFIPLVVINKISPYTPEFCNLGWWVALSILNLASQLSDKLCKQLALSATLYSPNSLPSQHSVQLMSWCKTHATSDLSTLPFLTNPSYWLSLVATCSFSLITMPDLLSICKA